MDIAGVDVEIDVIKEYPELEDLVVNSSIEDQNFNSSKYGFKSVKIKAIKGEELDLNPSTEQQNVEGVFTKVKVNAIKTQKLNTVPTTQEQVIKGLFDEVTVNAIEGQELNLNPSEEKQNFEGVFLGVNINPIQVEEITTDLDFSSSDTLELAAQEGAYIKKATINKPSNLKPENIKSGENVCGVEGTNADTSDATATAEDIREGKIAYVKGERIEGNVAFNTAIEGSMTSKDDFKLLVKEIDGNVVLNTTDAKEFFYGYSNLESVKSLGTSKLTSMYGLFYNCTNLKDVCVMDWSSMKMSGTAKLNMTDVFYGCDNLSDESLNNIMASCISATGVSSNKTLSNMGLYNVADRCKKLSNYEAFIAAGWTF